MATPVRPRQGNEREHTQAGLGILGISDVLSTMKEVLEESKDGLCANIVKLVNGTLKTCIDNLHEATRGLKGGKVKNLYL